MCLLLLPVTIVTDNTALPDVAPVLISARGLHVYSNIWATSVLGICSLFLMSSACRLSDNVVSLVMTFAYFFYFNMVLPHRGEQILRSILFCNQYVLCGYSSPSRISSILKGCSDAW